MCYVCNCFSWTLDILQRVLTFILSCWLALSVCCGLIITVVASIAYGYNYCLAEFITLTRHDVRVYMRRGQFYDRPDLRIPKRRFGEEDDVFPYNLSDYHQEVPLGDDSLSEKLLKDQDTRKYAEKLTKYSKEKAFADSDHQTESLERTFYYTPPSRTVSIALNRISTSVIPGGSSEIVMRVFEPQPNVPDLNDDVENEDYRVRQTQDEFSSKKPKKGMKVRVEAPSYPDVRIRVEDSPKRTSIKMRHWGITAEPFVMDYNADVDENVEVYRAA